MMRTAITVAAMALLPVAALADVTPNAGVSSSGTVDRKADSSRSSENSRSVDLKTSTSKESRHNKESREERGSGEDMSIEMGGGIWFPRALAVHVPAAAECVDSISSFYGISAKQLDGLDWDPDNLDGYRDVSVCALAINNAVAAATRKLGRRPGLLPDPESVAAAGILSRVNFDAALSAADLALGDRKSPSQLDKTGMAWNYGRYQFRAENGVVAVLASGRMLFDQDHIDGYRYAFKVSADSKRSESKSKSTGGASSSSTDTSASMRQSSSGSRSGSRAAQGSASVGAGK